MCLFYVKPVSSYLKQIPTKRDVCWRFVTVCVCAIFIFFFLINSSCCCCCCWLMLLFFCCWNFAISLSLLCMFLQTFIFLVLLFAQDSFVEHKIFFFFLQHRLSRKIHCDSHDVWKRIIEDINIGNDKLSKPTAKYFTLISVISVNFLLAFRLPHGMNYRHIKRVLGQKFSYIKIFIGSGKPTHM